MISDPVPVTVASDTPYPIEVAVPVSTVISIVPVSKKAVPTELVSMVAGPPCRTVTASIENINIRDDSTILKGACLIPHLDQLNL